MYQERIKKYPATGRDHVIDFVVSFIVRYLKRIKENVAGRREMIA